MRLALTLLATAALMTRGPFCAPERSTSGGNSTTSSHSTSATGSPMMDNVCMDTVELVNACSDMATSPCPASLPTEYVLACRTGCMMETCPKEITCTEVTAFKAPCGDCTDMHGSTFWASLIDHGEACSSLVFDPSHAPTAEEQAQFSQCLQMTMEQKCAALVGTDWTTKLPK